MYMLIRWWDVCEQYIPTLLHIELERLPLNKKIEGNVMHIEGMNEKIKE